MTQEALPGRPLPSTRKPRKYAPGTLESRLRGLYEWDGGSTVIHSFDNTVCYTSGARVAKYIGFGIRC